MAKPSVDLGTWRELYDRARRVWELRPWDWMEEVDVFGVDLPGTDQTAFVSVMGKLGAHLAVAVYPDAQTFAAFCALQVADPVEPERVLEIRQIQLSFESRKDLETRDRRIVERLGLRFRGPRAWPMFRSFRPGFAPWFLESTEAELLITALDQLLEVAPRIRSNPDLVWPGEESANQCLIRTSDSPAPGRASADRARARTSRDPGPAGPDPEASTPRDRAPLRWRDTARELAAPPPAPHVVLEPGRLRQYLVLPQIDQVIEADFFLALMPIRRHRRERARFPFMLMLVEAKTGQVLRHDVSTVEESVGRLLSEIPEQLLNQFEKQRGRPARITLRPGRLEHLLRPIALALNIELGVRPSLPALDEAKASLIRFLTEEPGEPAGRSGPSSGRRPRKLTLKTLRTTPPWKWPEEADRLLLGILSDSRARRADRLLAAELAGDYVVINDALADALLEIGASGKETEELRSRAVLSLGPALEHMDRAGFKEPSNELALGPLITEETMLRIQKILRRLYMDGQTPAGIRRRVLETSVRAPLDWQRGAVRAAYDSGDPDWQATAVFCMGFVPGFEKEVLEALESEALGIRCEAVRAAGERGFQEAWPRVRKILTSGDREKPLLLAAIDAAADIQPEEAGALLADLVDAEDEDISQAAYEAMVMAGMAVDGAGETEEFEADGPGPGDDEDDETIH